MILRIFLFFSLYSYVGYLQAQSRPHVFIILCDDLGYGDLSINGHPYIQTPNIDSFATHARQLAFYSASPICSPSRAALLTGRVPSATGVYSAMVGGDTSVQENFQLTATESNVVQLLRDNGYATFHSGKWHYTKLFNPTNYRSLGFNDAVKTFNKPARVVFDSMIAMVNQSLLTHPDQPIFGMINPHESHAPTDSLVVPPYDSLIYTYGYDTITQDLACHPGTIAFSSRFDDDGGNLKYYYGCVSNLDAEFGRFLAFLEEKGIRDSSIILFTSDNGPEDYHPTVWGSPGCQMSGLKRQMYEGGIRVPGYVQYAGRWNDGQEVSTPTGLIDVYPTLAGVLHLDLNNGGQVHGENVATIWDLQQDTRAAPMYFHLIRATSRDDTISGLNDYYGHAALKTPTGQYKLFAEMECIPDPGYALLDDFLRTGGLSTDTRKYRLFDIWSDPLETVDIKSQEPILFEQLRAQMLLIDRGIRRQAPRFSAQSQWEKSKRHCTSCDSNVAVQCPESIYLDTTAQVLFPDVLSLIQINTCLDMSELTLKQYPPANAPLTNPPTHWVDFHVLRKLDHLASCHIPVIYPRDIVNSSTVCKQIVVALAPNPAENTIQMICQNCPKVPTQVSLFDAIGRSEARFECENPYDCNMDISQLASGMHFLKVNTRFGCGVAKFVKQ